MNSTFKLVSSCIAERIKSLLSHLVSTDQTGFIPGRYIGDNCRFIYDILHFTEEDDIPGILLLIDFEKAFDSIFCSFVYVTLKFFNLGESVIKWVRTFHKDITSVITQIALCQNSLMYKWLSDKVTLCIPTSFYYVLKF